MEKENVGVNKQFKCLRCGRCCIATDDILAYPEDVRRWKREKRYDILEYVDDWEKDRGDSCCYEFTAPSHRRGCAFLRKENGKYKCTIHETRPEPCRQFPCDNEGRLEFNQALRCKGMEKLKQTAKKNFKTNVKLPSNMKAMDGETLDVRVVKGFHTHCWGRRNIVITRADVERYYKYKEEGYKQNAVGVLSVRSSSYLTIKNGKYVKIEKNKDEEEKRVEDMANLLKEIFEKLEKEV